MKSFISKIGIYLLATYVILFALQFIVDNGLKKANDNDFGDWNRILKGEINSDIIILGNSRAFVQYNPVILEKQLGYTCYNLGMDGTPIGLQNARWKMFLEYNSNPKILILNVDLLSLDKGKRIYSYGQYLPYLNNKHIENAIIEYKQNIKYLTRIPLLKYNSSFALIRKGIVNYFYPENNYGYIDGFCERNDIWEEGLANVKKILNKDGNIIFPENNLNDGKRILEELIQSCVKERIKILLVHTPYYYKLYNHLPQQKELINYLNTVSYKFNVPFIDYSSDSLMYSTDYFYNTTHLNNKGASIFSSKLANKLKNIISDK
jgi:hypothetical protein